MTDQEDIDIKIAPSSPTVGERLKQTREAKNYSLAEVAAQLRLTKDILENLEAQRWDKLHGRTYARGYFASYVKFLGLPHDEMLALFNMEYTVTDAPLKLHGLDNERHGGFPWLAMIVVILLAVTLWFAFQQWQKLQQQDAAQAAAEQEADGFADSVVEPLDTTPFDDMPATEPAEAEPELPGQQQDEPLIDILPPPSAGEDEATAPVDEPAERVSAQRADEDTLELSFSNDCWVEVSSAEKGIMISRLMHAGQSLALNSASPLTLLLGRASAAVVVFNDEQLDLAPHVQGDVARLTLGGDAL